MKMMNPRVMSAYTQTPGMKFIIYAQQPLVHVSTAVHTVKDSWTWTWECWVISVPCYISVKIYLNIQKVFLLISMTGNWDCEWFTSDGTPPFNNKHTARFPVQACTSHQPYAHSRLWTHPTWEERFLSPSVPSATQDFNTRKRSECWRWCVGDLARGGCRCPGTRERCHLSEAWRPCAHGLPPGTSSEQI